MSNAYYAHIRYVGLGDRITGTNEAPLRLVDGQLCVKRRSHLLPVIGLDADGYALVRIAQDGFDGSYIEASAVAQTPRTPEGYVDYEALKQVAPALTSPWDVPELAGLKTHGPKPSNEPKARTPKGTTPTTAGTPVVAQGMRLGATPVAPAKSAKPKASPGKPTAAAPAAELSREMVISYLAALSPEGRLDLVKALSTPAANTTAKPKAKARKAS